MCLYVLSLFSSFTHESMITNKKISEEIFIYCAYTWQGLMSVKITLEELAAESDEKQVEIEDEIREIRELLDS